MLQHQPRGVEVSDEGGNRVAWNAENRNDSLRSPVLTWPVHYIFQHWRHHCLKFCKKKKTDQKTMKNSKSENALRELRLITKMLE